MTITLLVFTLCCLCTAEYKNPFKKFFHEDAFARENTERVNGIFVFLVFLSHFHFEVMSCHKIDSIYLAFQRICGQCVVCPFLFYSGYGIYKSLRKDRAGYTKRLLLVKFPQLLLRFDFCVLLYAATNLFMGRRFTLKDLLLSLLTIRSLCNSNWYISYILISYVVVYIAFTLFDDDRKALAVVIGSNVLYCLLFTLLYGMAEHYYVTSLVLPLGIAWGMYQGKIEPFIKRLWPVLFPSVFVLYAVLWLGYARLGLPAVTYNAVSLLMTLSLVLFTYKVRFRGRVLSWLGKNVFWIYIMQHLPMEVFKGIQKYSNGGGMRYTLLSAFLSRHYLPQRQGGCLENS